MRNAHPFFAQPGSPASWVGLLFAKRRGDSSPRDFLSAEQRIVSPRAWNIGRAPKSPRALQQANGCRSGPRSADRPISIPHRFSRLVPFVSGTQPLSGLQIDGDALAVADVG